MVVTVDGGSVPVERLEVGFGVPALSDFGHGVEGDVVGVIDEDEVIELVVSREGDGLLGDSFLEAAVTSESDDVVVEEGVLGSIELGSSALAGKSVTNGVANSLTEWAGGRFDAWSFIVLRVTGSDAVKLTEILQSLKRDLIAGEVQPAVDEHGTMTSREDEAVAVEPLGCGGVEIEGLGEKDGTDFGASERESEVAG